MSDRTIDFMRAEVRAVRRLAPHLIRVIFGGAELDRFVATGHPDQRIHIALPAPGAEPLAPTVVDGRADYTRAGESPPLRNYTVRAWDERTHELTVDFADHGNGPAVEWARAATPGDALYLNADIGWYRPPADTAWQLLVADLAGLPALAHIVEELPATTRATVIVELPEQADLPVWRTAARLDVRVLAGTGNGLAPSALAGAVRAIDEPEEPAYVWAATEAAESRAIRKHAREAWGLDRERVDSIGYWRLDSERWLARYRAVEAEMEGVWDSALRSGLSEGEAEEIYDEALERAGL